MVKHSVRKNVIVTTDCLCAEICNEWSGILGVYLQNIKRWQSAAWKLDFILLR